MILILSKSYNEQTTIKIIDWLIYRKQDYYRVNASCLEQEGIFNLTLTNSEESECIKINDCFIDIDKVKVVWFRRWLDHDFSNYIDTSNSISNTVVNKHIGKEFSMLSKIFFNKLKQKSWVSSPNNNLNKIKVLGLAKKVGLSIPATLITNQKHELLNFKKKHPKLITKAISDLLAFRHEGDFTGTYTVIVDDIFIDSLPEEFFFSLFQEAIKKEVELRVFYLDGNCYTMAIFSQLDSKTSIDFRNYNNSTPNRNVPFQLPDFVELRIKSLMDLLNLDNGSIDIILTPDKEYVFLEVNAVGQFGMVSVPCNYFLEEKLADFLIKKHNDENKENTVAKHF